MKEKEGEIKIKGVLPPPRGGQKGSRDGGEVPWSMI